MKLNTESKNRNATTTCRNLSVCLQYAPTSRIDHTQRSWQQATCFPARDQVLVDQVLVLGVYVRDRQQRISVYSPVCERCAILSRS